MLPPAALRPDPSGRIPGLYKHPLYIQTHFTTTLNIWPIGEEGGGRDGDLKVVRGCNITCVCTGTCGGLTVVPPEGDVRNGPPLTPRISEPSEPTSYNPSSWFQALRGTSSWGHIRRSLLPFPTTPTSISDHSGQWTITVSDFFGAVFLSCCVKNNGQQRN